jgi:hypothetical protein
MFHMIRCICDLRDSLQILLRSDGVMLYELDGKQAPDMGAGPIVETRFKSERRRRRIDAIAANSDDG